MLNMVEINKIKLDKADRTILAELDKNCRIHSTILAKKTNKSRQAVDYRIKQLINQSTITGFQASINPHKMGYKIYKIYVKLRNVPKEKEKLYAYLRSLDRVYWLGECSGRWDLIFGVFAKSDYEFFELKNEFFSKFNKIIVDDSGQVLIDVQQYPKMYFTSQISDPVLFGGTVIENELDKLDKNILKDIVNDGRISLIELAEKEKTSIMVIKNRLKKLEQKGIIIQYRIGVNLDKIGLELYKAIISLEKYSREDEKRFLQYVSKLSNIQYFIRNLWQIELELVVNNYQEYYDIIENLKKEFSDVIKTVDFVLMKGDEWTPGFKNIII